MDLKQLRALVTVAQTGNVTKASALLNIVQPAVSRQLRLLEEDVGVLLFERGRHGMVLTEAGASLVEYARRIMNEVDRARAEIRPKRGPVGGIVTIGLLPSTCDLISSALLTRLKNEYPGIRARITVGYGGHLQQWLEAGEIDAALLYDPKPVPTLQIQPLLEEALWVVGEPRQKLRKSKPVTMAWVAERPVILPSAPHGLRNLVNQAAADAGIKLNIAAETNSLSVQKSLVLGGHGLTILPSVAIQDELKAGLLSAAPLSEPSILRRVVLATIATRQATSPVRATLPLLVACMRDAVAAGEWPAARWLA